MSENFNKSLPEIEGDRQIKGSAILTSMEIKLLLMRNGGKLKNRSQVIREVITPQVEALEHMTEEELHASFEKFNEPMQTLIQKRNEMELIPGIRPIHSVVWKLPESFTERVEALVFKTDTTLSSESIINCMLSLALNLKDSSIQTT